MTHPGDEPLRNVGRLAGHSVLYGLAGALGKAAALLTVPVVTRLLSPAEYGLADLANTFAAMLAMLAMFAGDIPAARLAGPTSSAENRNRVLSTYVWSTGVVAMAVALALLPMSESIAGKLWSSPDSGAVAILAILLIPAGAIQASLITTLRIAARPVAFAVLATIDLLAQMLLALLFVAVGWGALGMVAGLLAGSLIGLVAAAYGARALVPQYPNWRLGLSLLREGAHFLPAALGFVVATYVVRLILVGSEGSTGVGLFGVATRLAGGLALVTTAFTMAWGPMGLSMRPGPRAAQHFGRVVRMYAPVAALAAIGVGALGPETITLVSGVEYIDGSQMLPGVLVGTAMAGGFYVVLVAAGVHGHGQAVATAALVGSAVQVGATAALMPLMGVQSVGAGAILGQAASLSWLMAAAGQSVSGGWFAVGWLGFAGLAGLVLQALNASPSETFPLRLILAATVGTVSAAIGVRVVRTTRLVSA